MVRACFGPFDGCAVLSERFIVPTPVGEVEGMHAADPGEQLVVVTGQLPGGLEVDVGGRPASCECVDVAELAMGVGGKTVVAVRRGQVGAVLQEDCALVVVAAHGMHQCRAELEQADGLEMFVTRLSRSVGGPAQALQPGVDRAGGEGGAA